VAPKIIVRPAVETDGPIISKFNAQMALETEHRALDHARLRSGVEAVLRDPTKGSYFVAEVTGTVVGQLMITFEWSDWRNGTFWWIQSVYVTEDHRGKGVFKALFRFIEQEAKKRKDVCGIRLYVEKDNERAKKTYERVGMDKTAYELLEIDFVLKKSGGH
jgi:GNAT superfamily N-acetyltransferase